MVKTKMANRRFLTPLDIPEGRKGKWEVKREVHPAGKEFQLASLRCALLGGQKSTSVSWPFETVRHILAEDGRTWMTDLPCEMAQIYAAVKGLWGRVLLGGLGLGLVATVLSKMKSVERIVVVEKSREAIALVAPYLPDSGRIEVVEADLFQYLKDARERAFDDAFFDIWQCDGEGTFFDTVCPLYDASYGKVKRPPRNWNEDVMRGQLFHSLQGRLLYETGKLPAPYTPKHAAWVEDGSKAPWHNWAVPFFQWWKKACPTDAEAQRNAGFYASVYGRWRWLEIWERMAAS